MSRARTRRLGQFFTPPPLARLLTERTLAGFARRRDPDPLILLRQRPNRSGGEPSEVVDGVVLVAAGEQPGSGRSRWAVVVW